MPACSPRARLAIGQKAEKARNISVAREAVCAEISLHLVAAKLAAGQKSSGCGCGQPNVMCLAMSINAMKAGTSESKAWPQLAVTLAGCCLQPGWLAAISLVAGQYLAASMLSRRTC